MRNLLETLRVEVKPEHIRRLRIIESEDYTGVIRKTNEHFRELGREVTPEYLVRGVLALKQYYAIALLDPANSHAISAEVDPFWHSHLLFSEKYMKFSNAVVGDYMHHMPLNRDDPAQMEHIRRLYNYTIEVMGKVFALDHEFWPVEPSNEQLICWHFGKATAYKDIQPIRLFEETHAGRPYAFAY